MFWGAFISVIANIFIYRSLRNKKKDKIADSILFRFNFLTTYARRYLR